MGINNTKAFFENRRSDFEPLYHALKIIYECREESNEYKNVQYRQYLASFCFSSYEDWCFDFGKSFMYDCHHGDELNAMERPDYYFNLWEAEVVEYFIKTYSQVLSLYNIKEKLSTVTTFSDLSKVLSSTSLQVLLK